MNVSLSLNRLLATLTFHSLIQLFTGLKRIWLLWIWSRNLHILSSNPNKPIDTSSVHFSLIFFSFLSPSLSIYMIFFLLDSEHVRSPFLYSLCWDDTTWKKVHTWREAIRKDDIFVGTDGSGFFTLIIFRAFALVVFPSQKLEKWKRNNKKSDS